MEKKQVHEIVHELRQKPEHVRQNMAFGIAAGTTLVVALGWFGAMSITGSFSLAPTSPVADAGASAPTPAKNTSLTDLMAAAGAAIGATATTAPASITIVDANATSSKTSDQSVPQDATVIHF